MDIKSLPDNPYLLLTPGPLSTTKSVKATMLRDWCTWDDDYKNLVQEVREKLVRLGTDKTDRYTCVLMQGSGTFSVESIISTAVPESGKLLVLPNGAYGDRIVQIAKTAKINCVFNDSGELEPPDLEKLDATLKEDRAITHVAVVHSETTTGMLNPIEKIGKIVKKYGKIFIVDAMSSFGGIPFRIVDPALNRGASVLSFRSPHINVPLTRATIALAGKPKARFLYLLHTLCWNTAPKGGAIGTVTFETSDGR
ncbi:MAG: aminotransferase class V-fold PLP-dependent enzyme, partial [Thermodesulfobacteriota bacterium]